MVEVQPLRSPARRGPGLPLLLVLLAAILAAAVPGGPAVAAQPSELPRFLVESLVVEGVQRASHELIVSEARLATGAELSESELREALFRVRRLPFILGAALSLRKGTERGRYQVVIEVVETTRFFYYREGRFFRFAERVNLEDNFLAGDAVTWDGTVGWRHFVGKDAVLFLAHGPEAVVQLGYTQYDLFGRGMVLSFGATENDCCPTRVFPLGLDPAFSSWRFDSSRVYSLALTVPVQGNHSLQVSLDELRGEGSRRQPVLGELDFFSGTIPGKVEHQEARVTWTYDSTDDALLPTSGTEARAGLYLATLESPISTFRLGPNGFEFVEEPPLDSAIIAVEASGARHWPLTSSQSLSLGLRASAGRSRVENVLVASVPLTEDSYTSYRGSLRFGWSKSLWGRSKTLRVGDLRLELGAEYGWEGISPSGRLPDVPLERLEVSATVTFRNRWGVLRAGFSYLDLGQVLR